MGLFRRYVIDPPSIPGMPDAVKNYGVTGFRLKCQKDPNRDRPDVLKRLKLGAPIVLEYFEDEGKPEYLAIDCRSGLDIGLLNEPAAEWLKTHYPSGIFAGKLSDNNKLDVTVELSIYGERMFYSRISRAQAGVIYKAYKEKKIEITKKNISYIYDICDKDDAPSDITSQLGRVIEKIFDDDYIGANSILKSIFKE